MNPWQLRVCLCVCVHVVSLVWLQHSCRLLTCKTDGSVAGSPLAVCLSRRGEAVLSLSLPGGGISSPTRRKRAEREEGRRVGGVA